MEPAVDAAAGVDQPEAMDQATLEAMKQDLQAAGEPAASETEGVTGEMGEAVASSVDMGMVEAMDTSAAAADNQMGFEQDQQAEQFAAEDAEPSDIA